MSDESWLPTNVGTLVRSIDPLKSMADFVTYVDPATGDEYAVSGLSLAEIGTYINEGWIRQHGRKRSYTGVDE